MAYAYQQNLFDGASAGYVKYNISPDFGTPICAGETITVTGQAYNRDNVSKRLAICASTTGAYRESSVVLRIPKATVTSFTINFQMWDLSTWGAERLIQSPIHFEFDYGSGNGDRTLQVSTQEISFLQYRVNVSYRSVQFERYALNGSDYERNDEGRSVMGAFAISLPEGRTASDITSATVKITSDGDESERTITIPSSAITSALTENGYVETIPALFSGIDFDTADYYTLLFSIGDAYNTYSSSILISRAFANVHMSGCSTGGVAFGRFSPSTEGHPRFDCVYPAYFSGGLGAPLGMKQHLVRTSNKSCASGSNVDILTYTATEAGLYLFVANVRYATNTSGRRATVFEYRNGTDASYIANDSRTPVSGSATRATLMAVKTLSVGDTVTLQAYQNSGSNLNVEGNTSGTYTFMDIVRIA